MQLTAEFVETEPNENPVVRSLPIYMFERSRVFSEIVNGARLDSEIDVYRALVHAGCSPLIRTNIFDIHNVRIEIVLKQKTGQPILGAFRLTYIGLIFCNV